MIDWNMQVLKKAFWETVLNIVPGNFFYFTLLSWELSSSFPLVFWIFKLY